MELSIENTPHLRNHITEKISFILNTSIVGRHEDCDIVLAGERGASRKHARISIDNDRVYIMDLGSLNGTLVNGREIEHQVELHNEDSIVFDEQIYSIIIPNQQDAQAANANTVIVDKLEAQNPDRIRPAIRIIDEDNNLTADATQSAHTTAEPPPLEFDEFPIAATSRPGGDAMPQARREANSGGWNRWYVWVPLLLLILLGSLYVAYKVGQSTPTFSGNNTSSS